MTRVEMCLERTPPGTLPEPCAVENCIDEETVNLLNWLYCQLV